jgi:bacillithiol system protein YtxJ
MSVFKNIFGNSTEENNTSKMNWCNLTDIGQLKEIVNESTEKPVLIFKHSTRCSVSRMVLKQFENDFDLEEKITPYFLDLLEHRSISNEIADRFNVVHQSPQIIVVKEGKSVYDESHESIDVVNLKKLI